MKSTVLSVLFGLLVLLGTCSGHGYVHQSRSRLCHASASSKNKNCGGVQWEPQSLEAPKGFPGAGPKDGLIASAELPQFHELDAVGAERWTLTPISTYVVGERDGKLVLDFPWTLTVSHMTAQFEYFISKPTFDPTTPLTRAQLELTPFCVDDSARGTLPPREYVSRNCMLDAAKYSGHHVILGVWTIGDTPNAFYQVIDVDFPVKPSGLASKNRLTTTDSSASMDSSNTIDSSASMDSSNTIDSSSSDSAMPLSCSLWLSMASVFAILIIFV